MLSFVKILEDLLPIVFEADIDTDIGELHHDAADNNTSECCSTLASKMVPCPFAQRGKKKKQAKGIASVQMLQLEGFLNGEIGL